jgi:transposase
MESKIPEVAVMKEAKPGRRRRFSAEEKRRMLDEAAAPGESLSGVARRYDVSPSLMFRWRQQMDEGSMAGLEAGESVVAQTELRQLQAQVRELERLLGRKTLENEILRDAVRIAREKKLILSAAPGARDSAVSDTLRGVETGDLSGHKIHYQTKIVA